MRALIQRVTRASVEIDAETVGAIGAGFLILLGVSRDDTEKHANALAEKVAVLRVFEDEADKMNLSLLDTGRAALVVSQFTLYADTRKGRRPSFTKAAPPKEAERLYTYFVQALKGIGVPVQTGRFQAMMQVALVNDGPVTFMLDTEQMSV